MEQKKKMNIWEKIQQIPSELRYFAWLIVVAIIGGLVGFATRTKPQNKTKKQIIYIILFTIISSMFIAYITFEIMVALIDNQRLAIAIAGFAAYSGTDLLIELQNQFVNKIKDKIDKI